MTTNKVFEEEINDLSLRDILKTLHEKRRILIVVTLLIGILAAGVSLIIENSYQSVSALIIKSPELQITGEASPLKIEMLKALADSTEIKSIVFAKMLKLKALDEDIDFREFQKHLATFTEKQLLVTEPTLPLLQLIAESTRPETAALISNTWAEVVMDKSQNLYKGNIEVLNDFIDNVYGKANTSLIQSENQLTSLTLKANLVIEKPRLAEMQAQTMALNSAIFTYENEIYEDQSQINIIRNYLQSAELNGQWIADVFEESFLNNKEFDKDSLSTTSLRIVLQIEDQLSKEKELLEYRKHSEYDIKVMELEDIAELVPEFIGKADTEEMELLLKKKNEEAYNEQLANTPEKFTLNKAITDDALWNAHVDNKLSPEKNLPTLRSEELNPLYQSLKSNVSAITISIKSSEEKIKFFRKREKLLRDKVQALADDVGMIKSQIDSKELQLERVVALTEQMRELYGQDKKELERLVPKQIRDLENLKLKRTMLQNLEPEANRLKKKIAYDEQAIQSLGREIENFKSISVSLASKSEEVALLKISAEQASRSGTAILYHAEKNPQKVAPHRSKIVLTSMALGFVLMSALFITMQIIRES